LSKDGYNRVAEARQDCFNSHDMVMHGNMENTLN